MRRTMYGLLVLGLVSGSAAVAAGGGSSSEADAIIQKAIKAHFPKGLDAAKKKRGFRTKGKGTLHIMGMDLDFTQETAVQLPSKFKEVMELTVMGNNVKTVTVYNGKEGWLKVNDKDVPVKDAILNELKEVASGMALMQGMFEKAKGIEYSLLGEAQVNGKPAVGVKVSRKGHKDINLYFDKTTGLTVKFETRKTDLASGQEVTEERYITEYQDVDGRKVAKKVEAKRNGNPFIEVEIGNVQILDRIDDSEFARPE